MSYMDSDESDDSFVVADDEIEKAFVKSDTESEGDADSAAFTSDEDEYEDVQSHVFKTTAKSRKSAKKQIDLGELKRRRQLNSTPKPLPSRLEGKLFTHQQAGFNWLASLYDRGLNGILADEMGLGKTIQTIALICRVLEIGEKRGPFIVIAPLSTLENWVNEFKKFSPSVSVLSYSGDQEKRQDVRENITRFILEQPRDARKDPLPNFDVLITNFEMVIADYEFLGKFKFRLGVIDEAQRLKNPKSVLYKTLKKHLHVNNYVLLSGTPVQNDLDELGSLLHFVDGHTFRHCDDFVNAFAVKGRGGKHVLDERKIDDLHKLLRMYILRRTKLAVAPELPRISEFVLYTPLSPLQRDLYMAVLKKQSKVFLPSGPGSSKSTSVQLQNILMQLRKVFCHPYLFDGVEPEPFRDGPHLFEASGKLMLLEKILPKLKDGGHRVLLFSQFVHMLDVIQDYLTYRGHTYERLDGSVRGEERNLAVTRFSGDHEPAFVFLLSTRAGGLGLNLVAADTVIFFDSDFNPQVDLQAMARVHRYGQKKDIRAFRLVCKSTIEEAMLSRSMEKLKLQNDVIDKAGLSSSGSSGRNAIVGDGDGDGDEEAPTNTEAIIRFGLRFVCGDDGDKSTTTIEESADAILNRALQIQFLDQNQNQNQKDAEDKKGKDDKVVVERIKLDSQSVDSNVLGTALKDADAADADAADADALNRLVAMSISDEKEARAKALAADTVLVSGKRKRRLRQLDGDADVDVHIAVDVDVEDAEERKRKRLEKAAERKAKMWENAGYVSKALKLDLDDHDGQQARVGGIDLDLDLDVVDHAGQMHFVLGDVAQPRLQLDSGGPFFIICPVDKSGSWGSGGVFSALEKQYGKVPSEAYELAGDMKDLELGSAHLIPVSNEDGEDTMTYVCLCVILNWVRLKKSDGGGKKLVVDAEALTSAMKRVSIAALRIGASVHTSRLGSRGSNREWYSAERVFRRYVVRKGTPVFVYYYNSALIKAHKGKGKGKEKRKEKRERERRPDEVQELVGPSTTTTTTTTTTQAGIMSGVYVFNHGVTPNVVGDVNRLVYELGGKVGYDLRVATHIVTSIQGWDKVTVNAILSNPALQLHCVSPDWVLACSQKKVLVDTRPFMIPTGTTFAATTVALARSLCESDAELCTELKTDLITHGAVVVEPEKLSVSGFSGSGGNKHKFLVVLCESDSKDLTLDSEVKIVGPQWIDDCIEKDQLIV